MSRRWNPDLHRPGGGWAPSEADWKAHRRAISIVNNALEKAQQVTESAKKQSSPRLIQTAAKNVVTFIIRDIDQVVRDLLWKTAADYDKFFGFVEMIENFDWKSDFESNSIEKIKELDQLVRRAKLSFRGLR